MTRCLGIAALLPRRATAVLIALGALALTLIGPVPARASYGDQITEFDADYVLDRSGTVTVTEMINYHFGDTDRHGIHRDFITRERYDNTHDAAYRYHIVSVTSPTGAPVRYSTSTQRHDTVQVLELKIGDPEQYLDSQDETYKIVYTISGAMRTFDGYDELYWDAVGSGWDASVGKVKITATVPGGAQGLRCHAGPVGSTNGCTSAATSGGRVVITQDGLDAGSGVTMGIKITSGLVADDALHLVLRSDLWLPVISAGATVLTMIGSLVLGLLWYRSRGRDQRFLDLPPATTPGPGRSSRTGPSGRLRIPVQFVPPPIPVGLAGLVIDGRFEHRDTGATLVDLAVRGAIVLEARGRDVDVVLLDRSLATAKHEQALLVGMFKNKSSGARKQLGTRGSLAKAESRTVEAARSAVRENKWFRRVPGRMSQDSLSDRITWGAIIGVFAALLLAAIIGPAVHFTDARVLLAVLVPLAPLLIMVWIVGRRIARRGQRTATGRAVCDHVEGFRSYLATAEADQLQFEEGQDIFSAYLPWAIAFNLADRWTNVCARLAELGRIPDEVPDWYTGDLKLSAFSAGLITSSLVTSAGPLQTHSTSGSGSSGSGFGGGDGSSW